MENQEGRYVYILDEQNLPRIAYIKTAGQTDDNKWIVFSGIKEGERIITSGLQKVIPGRPVKIVDNVNLTNNEAKKQSLLDKIKDIIKR